jgi:hypothetical protein
MIFPAFSGFGHLTTRSLESGLNPKNMIAPIASPARNGSSFR